MTNLNLNTLSEGVVNQSSEVVRNYHRNGKLRSVEHYVGGVLNGQREEYDETGYLKCVETYKNGELDGEHKYFYRSGKLSTISYYKNGKLNGSWKSYYENGELKDSSYFKNGKKDCFSESFYEDGELKERCFYKNDKLISEYLSERFLIERIINPSRFVKTYHNNGQLKSNVAERYGMYFGPYYEYYDNGNVSVVGRYDLQFTGKKYGIWKWYHKNGQLWKWGTYIDGELDGLFEEYSENGELILKGRWENGEFIREYQSEKIPN